MHWRRNRMGHVGQWPTHNWHYFLLFLFCLSPLIINCFQDWPTHFQNRSAAAVCMTFNTKITLFLWGARCHSDKCFPLDFYFTCPNGQVVIKTYISSTLLYDLPLNTHRQKNTPTQTYTNKTQTHPCKNIQIYVHVIIHKHKTPHIHVHVVA